MQVGAAFGIRDGALRVGYEVGRKCGLLSRRIRAMEGWDRWSLERIAPGTTGDDLLRSRRSGGVPFFFKDARTLGSRLQFAETEVGRNQVLDQVEGILRGNLPYFGRLAFANTFPPDWFRNPATGEKVAPDRPWTTMRFASPDYGDLKFILEPSRFLFTYPLLRAYALSSQERFSEAFWQAVEAWAMHSPPMSGPLWICGQESSLRILAWSFALNALLNSAATSPERVERLAGMVAAHAWRAQQTLGYARSQRSNHLISEAVGLWTAGALFPEFKQAFAWRRLGAQLLEEAVRDQFTPEGVHLQYSFNYQRMVLQLLLWALRLSKIHGECLPGVVRDRTEAALAFTRTFVDPASGKVPNYGANDGSLILPLTNCEYGDYRPVLRLGDAVLGGSSDLGPGPWDEVAVWFGGDALAGTSRNSQTQPPSSAVTGFHRLGSRDSWAMVRAGKYQRRPFQADQLHVDIWHRGVNIASDAGTYLYNGGPPWDNALARTVVHNTITIDGRDQMTRAGRFLWVDWAQATGRSFSSRGDGDADSFEGQHDGFRALGIVHHRTVHQVADQVWIILDDILGTGEHDIRLHWLVPDVPVESFTAAPFHAVFRSESVEFLWDVFASSSVIGRLVREGKPLTPGDEFGALETSGWDSPTYGELRPAVSLIVDARSPLPVRLITVLRLKDDLRLESNGDEIAIWHSESELCRVSLAPQVESRSATKK